MTSEPGSAAWIPLPPKFQSRYFAPPSPLVLLLFIFPPTVQGCSLAEGVRQGRGSHHQLSCLPFYCLEEDLFFYSSLSHPHSCPLSHHWANPCPSSSTPGCAYSGSSAPQQGQSRSASLVIYPFVLGIFLSAHLLWRSSFFSPVRHLCFRPVPYFLSFRCSSSPYIRLCGEEHLYVCMTIDQQGCGQQWLPAAATIPWAIPNKQSR